VNIRRMSGRNSPYADACSAKHLGKEEVSDEYQYHAEHDGSGCGITDARRPAFGLKTLLASDDADRETEPDGLNESLNDVSAVREAARRFPERLRRHAVRARHQGGSE